MTIPKPNISTVFATPVVALDWPDADDLNRNLRDIILAREAASTGIKRSNVRGWHSENDLLTWDNEAVWRFRERLSEMAQELLNISVLSETRVPYNANFVAWANVLRDRGYHMVHDHPMAHWSGVYYVDAGRADEGDANNGKLELLDPRTGVNMVGLDNSVFASRCLLETRAGRMIFFPSWLKHVVHPFHGKGERISISYNLTFAKGEQ